VKKLIGLKRSGSSPNDGIRWTIKMHKYETTFSRNSCIPAIKMAEFLLRNHWIYIPGGFEGKQQVAGLFYQNLTTAEIVLKPFYIVFAEVSTLLNLNENELLTGNVFNPVGRTNRDIDRLATHQHDFTPIESHFSGALDDHPMFGSLAVLLIAQTPLWENFDAFDLVISRFVENREGAPWTLIVVRGIGRTRHICRVYNAVVAVKH